MITGAIDGQLGSAKMVDNTTEIGKQARADFGIEEGKALFGAENDVEEKMRESVAHAATSALAGRNLQ